MTTSEAELLLKKHGIKPTANRILVIREIAAASRPVSLADLEVALAPMDRASIFRVLELLAEKELIHLIEDGTRAIKYELCHSHGRHSVEDQHVHFHCEKCKETFCLEDTRVPMILVPQGFEVRSVNYVLKGLCPECSKK